MVLCCYGLHLPLHVFSYAVATITFCEQVRAWPFSSANTQNQLITDDLEKRLCSTFGNFLWKLKKKPTWLKKEGCWISFNEERRRSHKHGDVSFMCTKTTGQGQIRPATKCPMDDPWFIKQPLTLRISITHLRRATKQRSDHYSSHYCLNIQVAHKEKNFLKKRCSASVFAFNGEFQFTCTTHDHVILRGLGIFRLLNQDATKHFPSGWGDNEKTSLIFTHILILSSLWTEWT